MKTRNGFVSNSSSSSFILDLRKPRVKVWLENIKRIPKAEDCGRYTAAAVGEDAVQYAKEWIADVGKYYEESQDGLGHWILEWARKLGTENTVFIRESDEGMGGYLSDFGMSIEDVQAMSEAEMEYH